MSRRVIESLDEREVTFRETLLSSLFGENRPWPGEYLHHLQELSALSVFSAMSLLSAGELILYCLGKGYSELG